MDSNEIKTLIQNVCREMGPAFRLIDYTNSDWPDRMPEITNEEITFHLQYDSYRKKLNIGVSPYGRTPLEESELRRMYYNRIPTGIREELNLSIRCSIKPAEKIARDILRRLGPNAQRMAQLVKAKLNEIHSATNKLTLDVENFKRLLGDIPIRESHENERTKEFAWVGWINSNGTHREIARFKIRDGSVNLTLDDLPIDLAARIIKDVIDR